MLLNLTMPHLKLEYTESVGPDNIQPVFKELINILIENAKVYKENCKCKAKQIPVYAVGNNVSGHYYHLEISLLKGRPEHVRQKIGQASIESLKKCFSDKYSKNDKQFSVEIREMNTGNYFTSNTL